MDTHPKFIVEETAEGELVIILAKCTYHKELAFDKTKIKGGGWWLFDRENNVFTLYGESFDFGPASIEHIAECVQKKKVFSNSSLTRNITNNVTFVYSKEGKKTDLKTFKIQ